MQPIDPSSVQARKRIKELFEINLAQFFLYLITSALLLVVFNIKAGWNFFAVNLIGVSTGTDIFSNGGSARAHSFWTQVSADKITQGLFWALVGITIYILVWLAKNLVINIYNDIVADEFTHPATYSRKKYWESILFRKFFLAVGVIVLLSYLVTMIRLLPLLSRLFYEAIYSFDWVNGTAKMVLSIFATATLIYLLKIMAQVVVNAWKVINKNL